MYRWSSSGLGGAALNYPSIDVAIQKFEGYAPGTLAYQNNNPGNLVYAPWEAAYGCTAGGAGGFAKCPTYEAGQQIQDSLVTSYADKGLSLSDMIAKWSPPTASGNSQTSYNNYVASVATDTGLDPSLPISQQVSGDSIPSQAAIPDASASPDLSFLLDTSSGSNWPLLAGAVVAGGLFRYAVAS